MGEGRPASSLTTQIIIHKRKGFVLLKLPDCTKETNDFVETLSEIHELVKEIKHKFILLHHKRMMVWCEDEELMMAIKIKFGDYE